MGLLYGVSRNPPWRGLGGLFHRLAGLARDRRLDSPILLVGQSGEYGDSYVFTIAQSDLRHFVGTVSPEKMRAVCAALRIAMACD